MAMECSHCAVVTAEGRQCPKCGRDMRLTLLGDVSPENSKKVEGTRTKTNIPSAGERVGQLAKGLGWTTAGAVIGMSATALYLASSGQAPAEAAAANPAGELAIRLLLAIAAPTVAARLVGRGVYMAQFLGMAIGALGAPIVLGLFQLAGFPPAWYEWAVAPLFAAGASFAAGFKVAGKLTVYKEILYTPVGLWDKTAMPSIRELNLEPGSRWGRIIAGVLLGSVIGSVILSCLGALIAPMYRNDSMVNAVLTRVHLPVALLATALGAIVAGSGSRTGVAQGVVAALGIFGVGLIKKYLGFSFDAGAGQLVLYVLAGLVGGLIGRTVLGPVKVCGSVRSFGKG